MQRQGGSIRVRIRAGFRKTTRWLLPLALAPAGCVQPASSSEVEARQPAPPEPPAPPPCKDGEPTDPAATFPGSKCGWFLEDREGALRLHSLDLDPVPTAVGSVPEPCAERPCVFEGVETEIGPLVLVTVTSPHSEMPEGVLLGLASGERLLFVDLWAGAGESVTNEYTELGPSHALVPHDCNGKVGLFVQPRVQGGELTEPPAELLKREGIYTIEPQGLQRTDGDPKGCKALESFTVP